MIFLTRKAFIPEHSKPKGLTNKLMIRLPAMYLPAIDLIEVSLASLTSGGAGALPAVSRG
jgi:hypothetical protein